MSNKFGVFINLDYCRHSSEDCSFLWQNITEKMYEKGFLFEKRIFTIRTDIECDEISIVIRGLLNEIQMEQHDLYSFIADCFILNFDNYNDLTLPDTSDSINVEDISIEDLNALGIEHKIIY